MAPLPDAARRHVRRPQRRRVGALLAIMSLVSLTVAAVAIAALYRTAIDDRRDELENLAAAREAMIDGVFAATGSEGRTLEALTLAHREMERIGATGEFAVARLEGDRVVFLQGLTAGRAATDMRMGGALAEPMQLALAGGHGTMTGRDYRGRRVLAAYRLIEGPRWGLVAKMELGEVRAPFLRISGITTGVTLVLVAIGALAFRRFTDPVLARLEESEAHFRAAFERTPVGMSLTAPGGGLVEVNQAFCELLGYSADELARIRWADVTHPDDVDESAAVVGSILAGEREAARFEKRYLHRSGRVVWTTVTTTLVRDDYGKPLHFVTHVLDISERKRAEEALRDLNAELDQRVAERTRELSQLTNRLRREVAERSAAEKTAEQALRFKDVVLESSPVGITVYDGDGQCVAANRAAARIAGARREQLLQQNWQRIESWRGSGLRDAAEAALAGGREARVVSPVHTSFGNDVWLDCTFATFGADGDRHLLLVFSDITDLKRAEEAIRLLNADLERKVAALEEANRELEAFSYTVSHDLRAPLRAIDGFARLVAEEHGKELTDEALRRLSVVRNNATHMGRLIDDLLSFSRMSRQALHVERVDVAALVRTVLAELHGEREGRAVDVTVGALPPCEADPGLLKIVFTNLLSNAFKYSRPRDPALVEVSASPIAGETVYYVKDNGVGFDMRYSHKLFVVFQRLHRADEFEGTGVGLATVQRIVARHGGRVWADSAADEGATFSFTIGRREER